MTFVFKHSKEGFPVSSTEDVNQSYNAANASHSIFNIISAYLPTGTAALTITHRLNYVPKVWIFLVGSDADGTFYQRIPIISANTFKVDYYITDTNVVIERNVTSSAQAFKCIIFTRSPTP